MAAITFQSGRYEPGHMIGARSTARPVCRHGRGVPTARATYWRRRFVVAVLGIMLVLVMAQAGAALGGSTLAASERRPTSVENTVITVRPGDSLWSIAVRLAPGDDPRPIVDALEQARHGAPLQPGEKIEWAG